VEIRFTFESNSGTFVKIFSLFQVERTGALRWLYNIGQLRCLKSLVLELLKKDTPGDLPWDWAWGVKFG
jgi:hypothetical protein